MLFCRQEFCCFCERGEGALAGKIGSSQHLVNLAKKISIWQHLLNLATLPIICLSSLSEARLAESPVSKQLSDRNVSGAPTNTDFPLSLELPTHQQAARQRGLKLECAQINWHLCLLEPNGKVALKMKHCQTPRMFYTSCCKMVEAYTS